MRWRGSRSHQGRCVVSGIKPIETVYKGYRFRSRLEARWAVFFDALDIRWEYEKEGFELGEAGRYLPDFWLPEQRYWIEIKAEYPAASERKKLQAFAWGMPNDEVYLFDRPDFRPPFMEYSSNPRELPDFAGAWGRLFSKNASPDDYEGDCAQWWGQCTECMLENRPATFGVGHSRFMVQHAVLKHAWDAQERYVGGGCDDTVDLVEAYRAARQARFEHGENGAPKRRRPLGAIIQWTSNDPGLDF